MIAFKVLFVRQEFCLAARKLRLTLSLSSEASLDGAVLCSLLYKDLEAGSGSQDHVLIVSEGFRFVVSVQRC